MKPKKTNHLHHDGFTLIEVIVTLVIAAIMGSMLVTLMGTNLVKSALPVFLVGDQYKIVQQMEMITSRYREGLKSPATFDINTFKTTYVDTNSYVDTANTAFITLTGKKTGVADITTSSSILRVTLRSGDQTVQSFFTQ